MKKCNAFGLWPRTHYCNKEKLTLLNIMLHNVKTHYLKEKLNILHLIHIFAFSGVGQQDRYHVLISILNMKVVPASS